MTLIALLAIAIAAIAGLLLKGSPFLTMTIVSNPLIGQSRKKTGGVYFRKWKNLQILANKALTVANPNTVLQQKARSAFAQLVAMYRATAAVTAFGFQSSLGTMGAISAFQKYNNNTTVVTGTAPTATIVLAEVRTAVGSISPTVAGTVVVTNASANVVVPYSALLTGPGQALTDLARIAVYNATQDMWGFYTGAADRDDGTATVVMPANNVTADAIHTYLFFRALNGSANSDSTYVLDTV